MDDETSNGTGQRLDKYLQDKFPSYSRAFIKEQIRLGNFCVNEKKVKPFYVLRQSDLVGLAQGFTLPETPAIIPNPAIKLNLIYEDDDVIVIDKPAGLSVHPRADKNGAPLAEEIDNTLVSGLLAYYPAIADIKDKYTSPCPSPTLGEEKSLSSSPSPCEGEGWGGVNFRPGIVHRLDKDTSGVMIIAKNQPSFDWLKKQFKDRKVVKKYLTLVHGRLKEKQGEIKNLLHRASSDPTKQKISKSDGKEAVTQYQVIQEFDDYTLIEARPKTGRLHQIRVQLAWLGHPVVGDAKYGSSKLPVPPGLARQFLHAQELEIALPNSLKKSFEAPLPADFKGTLDALEKI